VDRPRLLLLPEWTEVEWTAIRPRLEEWADVASFDLPGVGDEPQAKTIDREAVVRRGLEELDRQGWERCFVAADGWGISSGVRLALARPPAVQGMILGHARLSHRREGDRAPINGAVWEAMNELVHKDHEAFILHGITQVTGGSVGEEVARQMVERFPHDMIATGFELLTGEDNELGELLAKLDCPLLFAKHEECLMATEEGFEDAAAAFPAARTISVKEAPQSSERFADAMREFCEQVLAGHAPATRSEPEPGRQERAE
jgi:pimeloyl-ACP methyl ester carboxylesterase